ASSRTPSMNCASARRSAATLSLALVLACPASAAEFTARSYVFGTIATVTFVGESETRARETTAALFREFDRMHRDLHTWQPGALTDLNRAIAAGNRSVRTTPEIAGLIRATQTLAQRSDESFNPAIGRLVALWSFHRNQPGGPIPDAGEIEKIVAAHPRMRDLQVSDDVVSCTNPAVQLDFGGYAKGYALDRAREYLVAHGITNALVDLGGN